ncbi:SURF1 family protein [Pseudomonas sp. R5(2019)]|uniref:SURF1 family protein n=1 Tax=Pseudomonas sp. R5(2019) TaxID=2697566 RepID=UPI001412E54D|nr:SURF1 family protein [Pseudomonas sp. R5(2019)]NBA96967.1 SURF1 family protein [Pseudomonas sp. R5(2019)]
MKRFRPGIGPTVVVCLLLPLMIGLGLWQLGRAEEKRDLLASHAERRAEAPIAAAQLHGLEAPAFRRIHLRGSFDPHHSVLLDNRIRDGQAGVELLQPFLDRASGLWLLVNRGWLPWPDRRSPPVFKTPGGTQSLNAWVYVAPGATFQLHADPTDNRWPRLLTAVGAGQLWSQLGREGFAREVRLEPGPAAYRVDWPVVAMDPQKHVGYAVQWFALALALSGLYLYFGWHNNKEKQHGSGHESIGPV